MTDARTKLLDKFFHQLTKFVGAINTVFDKCKRTKEELQNLNMIKAQNLVGKKTQYAEEWIAGVKPCLAAFNARERSAIETNTVPLLAAIDLRGKWEHIDQECVWEHLERINRTITLWQQAQSAEDGSDAFAQAQSMVATMMKSMGVQQDDATGRISMDFRSISNFVTKSVSVEQMEKIASGFGAGGEGGFGALLQGGLGVLTRALAEGPNLAENTRVVDTTDMRNPDSESSDSDE